MATVMTQLLGRKSSESSGEQSTDLVGQLERLAALRQAGDLTSAEFEQAKRALLAEERAT
jgi:hypothetical protein